MCVFWMYNNYYNDFCCISVTLSGKPGITPKTTSEIKNKIKNGVTVDNFQSVGILFVKNERLEIKVNCLLKFTNAIFRIFEDRWSIAEALSPYSTGNGVRVGCQMQMKPTQKT